MTKLIGVLLVMLLTTTSSLAETGTLPNFSFNSIDGGQINLSDFKNKVVLVTNTASKCGFTGQYKGLQKLYDDHKSEGLIVFGIPSTDFRQEYKDSKLVQNFCELNFGITFPMSEVTHVIGKNAHPFYVWLSKEYNFTPRWNFNKVLISKNGEVINTFGSMVKPGSKKLSNLIVDLLRK